MYNLAFVGLRLIALFLAVQALTGLAGLVSQLFNMEFGITLATLAQVIGYFLLPLAGTLALYYAAGPIAKRLVGHAADHDPGPVSVADLQSTLFAAVGAYLLFKGLSVGVPQFVGHMMAEPRNPLNPMNADLAKSRIHWLISSSLDIVFGIGLMLGARGLTRVLHGFQEFGLRDKRPSD